MAANRRLPPVAAETSQTLVAPFTGTVVATPAPPDQHVAAGAAVVVIEAMKMEHEIVAEHDGTVTELNVEIGQTVEAGQRLATLSHRNGPTPVDAASEDPEAAPRRPTWRRSASAMSSGSTTAAPTPSPSATARAAAPPVRTWPTCWTRAASWSTGRSCSPPRSSGVRAES